MMVGWAALAALAQMPAVPAITRAMNRSRVPPVP